MHVQCRQKAAGRVYRLKVTQMNVQTYKGVIADVVETLLEKLGTQVQFIQEIQGLAPPKKDFLNDL